MGTGKAKLQLQICPAGVAFGGGACLPDVVSDQWKQVWDEDGVALAETIEGLTEGTLYRWRVRALYDSPIYSHGPWRRLSGQSMEADIRSMPLAADLEITKSLAPEEPHTGGPITFTLTYHSDGPAYGVVITDIIPSGITDLHVSSSGADITDTGVHPGYVWQVEDLEPGEGGVITISGVAETDRILNTASISGDSPDPNLNNNSASVQISIPGIIYVDRNATGAKNGISWANAYTDLQAALDKAVTGDQIWVAEGIYKPTQAISRTASFRLKGGVALHGGFAGSENWLHERDWMAHPTVLSGDIGTPNNKDDNVYHVVRADSSVDATGVLDGFIIIGGNADGSAGNDLGGGLYNIGGSPTLMHITFAGNSAAAQGGGLYNDGGSPSLINVAFSGNSADHGAGVYNNGGSLTLINVTFSANSSRTREVRSTPRRLRHCRQRHPLGQYARPDRHRRQRQRRRDRQRCAGWLHRHGQYRRRPAVLRRRRRRRHPGYPRRRSAPVHHLPPSFSRHRCRG